MLGRNPLSQLPPRGASQGAFAGPAEGVSDGNVAADSRNRPNPPAPLSGQPRSHAKAVPVSSSVCAERLSEQPIAVRRITVERDRLVCEVCVPRPQFRYSSVNLAILVKAAYPDIVRHACVNEVSNRFVDVIDATSVPHMLEHLAIDEQIHASVAAERLVGATEWTCEQKGEAVIQLAFVDDLEALRAFKRALSFLNKSLAGLTGGIEG